MGKLASWGTRSRQFKVRCRSLNSENLRPLGGRDTTRAQPGGLGASPLEGGVLGSNENLTLPPDSRWSPGGAYVEKMKKLVNTKQILVVPKIKFKLSLRSEK